MGKLNKLSLSATILIASVILGGFYYASEANKQASIEKQQQSELTRKKDEAASALQYKQQERQAIAAQDDFVTKEKVDCVKSAQGYAASEYNQSYFCTSTYPASNCNTGRYLISQYNAIYDVCLQSKGLK